MRQSLIQPGKSRLAVLLMLSWPAVVEQLLFTAVSYVDAAMVGSLGARATAAVSLTGSVVWLVTGVFGGVGVGFSVQVAHAIGARDSGRARAVMRQSVLATAVTGVAVTALCLAVHRQIPVWLGGGADIVGDARRYFLVYFSALPFVAASGVFSALLRGMGDTRTPLAINSMTNLLNVLFNFLLIYPARTLRVFGSPLRVWGADLGVMGAALGTGLSMLVGAALLSWCIYHRAEPYKIYLRDQYAPVGGILRRAASLGMPFTLDRVFMNVGQMVMIRVIASLGTAQLAANHVAVTAESISYLPALGISFAATSLVGQSVGARDFDLAQGYGSLAAKVSLASSALAGGLLFLFARPLAGFFTPDPEVVAMAAAMLRIVAVAQPLFGVSIVLGGVLRGTGDARFPFYTTLFGMWALRVPLAPVLVYAAGMGLAGVWTAMCIDLNLRGALCIARFAGGKWRGFAGEAGSGPDTPPGEHE